METLQKSDKQQTDNQQMLSGLLEREQIDIKRSPLFDAPPASMPEDLDFDKVEGMMLGLAVADALGATSEGMLPARRRERYGEIRHYLPNPHADRRAVGLPTDDTQLAFWTLEQMLEDGGLIPPHLADRFCMNQIFGIGSTVSRFVLNHLAGMPWHQGGPKSAGNGSLMRIAPVVIPYLKSPAAALWADTALAAMLTHNDSASISSCLACVSMLWQLLAMEEPPEPSWWCDTFAAVCRPLERDDSYEPRGGTYTGYRGTLSDFVEDVVPRAYAADLSTEKACNGWYSGAYLLETAPSVLYVLMRHGESFEEAVVRAVNDTWDNDTIGAVVGALAGALHGKKAIPEAWLNDLPGRTTYDDDGKIYALLANARSRWGA